MAFANLDSAGDGRALYSVQGQQALVRAYLRRVVLDAAISTERRLVAAPAQTSEIGQLIPGGRPADKEARSLEYNPKLANR